MGIGVPLEKKIGGYALLVDTVTGTGSDVKVTLMACMLKLY